MPPPTPLPPRGGRGKRSPDPPGPAPDRRDEHERPSVNKTDIAKVQDHLRRTFANTNIRIVPRPKKDDSAEVYVGEEFLGVVSVDDEDGDRSFNFSMAILDIDLED